MLSLAPAGPLRICALSTAALGPHWERENPIYQSSKIIAMGVDSDMSHSNTHCFLSDVARETERHVKETDKEMEREAISLASQRPRYCTGTHIGPSSPRNQLIQLL